MAEVFLARQEGMAGFQRLAVVKKILPQFSTVSKVADMLLDEARIAAQLSHPNIVQIYELGKEDDAYFIAMEYIDGCDLATLARVERHRKSRVPVRLALRVVSEAAMGLDYEGLLNVFAQESAIKRLNETSDVAEVCVLLASDAGAGITGSMISIDGGTAPY